MRRTVELLVFLSSLWVPAMGGQCTVDTCAVSCNRATGLYARGELNAAIAELRQAISSCPAEPFYRFMLGNALYRAGDLNSSAASYREFVASRPEHLEAHMSLGFTVFELGQKSAAVEQWQVAVRLDPNSAFARAALASGLYATGDYGNAVIQYELAAALDSRYKNVETLAFDIRWKAPIRSLVSEIIRQIGFQGGN